MWSCNSRMPSGLLSLWFRNVYGVRVRAFGVALRVVRWSKRADFGFYIRTDLFPWVLGMLGSRLVLLKREV